MSPAAETPPPTPQITRPRAPLWARALPFGIAWGLAKLLARFSVPGSGDPTTAGPLSLLRRARQVDAAGHAWCRLGNRQDLRWICRRSTILGLEHRTRAETRGARVVHGVVPPGREALVSSLLQIFAPPTDGGTDPTPARVMAGERALALAEDETAVLPTLAWVEPSGHPRIHIAAPVGVVEPEATETQRLAILLAPFAEVLAEHPSAWPWHRSGPPPSLAPGREA